MDNKDNFFYAIDNNKALASRRQPCCPCCPCCLQNKKLSSKQKSCLQNEKKEKIMTITGIITHVGAPREFEVPSAQGGKKKMTAVEITLQSGNNTFIVDAYDNLVKYINDNGIRENDAVVAELRFDIRSIKTKDGNAFSQQNVTLNAINLINEKAF